MSITIYFQSQGPINSDGLVVSPNPSALILSGSKAEGEFAQRLVDAIEPFYRKGLEQGLFLELSVTSLTDANVRRP